MDLLRKDHLRVDSRDVDRFQRARPGAIFAMMQESAWRHAESLGFGYSHLQRQGRFWVLSRVVLEWRSHFEWGEEIDLETWPAGYHGAFALRDFRFSGHGGTCVEAATAWLIVDQGSRRPLRPREVMTLPPDCGKIRALNEVPPRIPAPGGCGFTRLVEAAWSDIDLNAHVNNTRYVDWILDGFSEDFHRRHLPRRFEINFLAELRQQQTLELNYLENPDQSWLVSGLRHGEDAVVRARLYWSTLNGAD